jgi:hypothetical protein
MMSWWLAADIPAMHPKRAGLPDHSQQVQYFISNDSTIACVGEIDEMVPRGQDVSDTRRKYSKVAGQDYIMLQEILRQTDFSSRRDLSNTSPVL